MKAIKRTTPLNAKTVIEYPAGTPIKDIESFDRSTHIAFRCPNHPVSEYLSKDPFCSSIFTTEGEGEECNCPIGEHVTSWAYKA